MKKLLWAILALIGIGMVAYAINNKEMEIDFLDDQFAQITKHFGQRKIKNEAVSSAEVAWHLDHTLKVINNISESIMRSDPEAYSSSFNIKQIAVHTTGVIPRGVAQSPRAVLPPDDVLLDSLHIQLAMARQNILKMDKLDEHAFYAHAVFGNLDRDETRRFLKIHTKHHLKIIRDILDEH